MFYVPQDFFVSAKKTNDAVAEKIIISVSLKGLLLDLGDTLNRGGINVKPDNVVRMYGNVHHVYGLSEVVPVDKFTRFQFILTEKENVDVGICLSEDYNVFLSTKYCFVLRQGRLPRPASKNIKFLKSKSSTLDGEAVNLALGKHAKQSSTIAPGEANYAVDGKTDQFFSIDAWQFNTITSTDIEILPWWEVDLGEDFTIRSIVIYKRLDKYEDDLRDFNVFIYDSNGFVTATNIFPRVAAAVTAFEFDNVKGRKIKVMLNGDTARILCLAEVQVFGNVIKFDVPIGGLFPLPKMNFNTLAFVQDRNEALDSNLDLMEESTILTDLSFSRGDDQIAEVSSTILTGLFGSFFHNI